MGPAPLKKPASFSLKTLWIKNGWPWEELSSEPQKKIRSPKKKSFVPKKKLTKKKNCFIGVKISYLRSNLLSLFLLLKKVLNSAYILEMLAVNNTFYNSYINLNMNKVTFLFFCQKKIFNYLT